MLQHPNIDSAHVHTTVVHATVTQSQPCILLGKMHDVRVLTTAVLHRSTDSMRVLLNFQHPRNSCFCKSL